MGARNHLIFTADCLLIHRYPHYSPPLPSLRAQLPPHLLIGHRLNDHCGPQLVPNTSRYDLLFRSERWNLTQECRHYVITGPRLDPYSFLPRNVPYTR
jgi:hypothetical protein